MLSTAPVAAPALADIDYVSRTDFATSIVRFAAYAANVTCPLRIKEDIMREDTEALEVWLDWTFWHNDNVSPVLGTNVMTTVIIFDDEGNHQLVIGFITKVERETPFKLVISAGLNNFFAD